MIRLTSLDLSWPKSYLDVGCVTTADMFSLMGSFRMIMGSFFIREGKLLGWKSDTKALNTSPFWVACEFFF